jgi:hypothetical protein
MLGYVVQFKVYPDGTVFLSDDKAEDYSFLADRLIELGFDVSLHFGDKTHTLEAVLPVPPAAPPVKAGAKDCVTRIVPRYPNRDVEIEACRAVVPLPSADVRLEHSGSRVEGASTVLRRGAAAARHVTDSDYLAESVAPKTPEPAPVSRRYMAVRRTKPARRDTDDKGGIMLTIGERLRIFADNVRWLHSVRLSTTFSQIREVFGKEQKQMTDVQTDVNRLQSDDQAQQALNKTVIQKLQDDAANQTTLQAQIDTLKQSGVDTAVLEQLASDQEAGIQSVTDALAAVGVTPATAAVTPATAAVTPATAAVTPATAAVTA